MMRYLFLGAIQGVCEWIPVSSEGMIMLARTRFFEGSFRISELVGIALFLHFGTFLSAVVYFHKDLLKILSSVFHYQKSTLKKKMLLHFLFISTAVSGFIGFMLLEALKYFESFFLVSSKALGVSIGIFLIINGFVQYYTGKSENGRRDRGDIKSRDSLILGIFQGLAVLPGISRSGLTVSMLLLRNFSRKESLRLSFLMSIPIVFLGNIALNIDWITQNLGVYMMAALFSAFIFGLITIHGFLSIVEKINFGILVVLFGIATILFSFF